MLTLGNKLRYKVDLYQPSTDQNAAGQLDDPVLYKAGLNANVEDLVGLFLERAQALSSEVNTRITIRYNADVQAGWTVHYSGLTYRVDYVRDPSIPTRQCFTELFCKRFDFGF